MFPRAHSKRPDSFEAIAAQAEAFLVFYSARKALTLGLIEAVHHETPPARFSEFATMRYQHVTLSAGPRKWRLLVAGEVSDDVIDLTPELAKLSIVQIASHGALQGWVEQDYRPENDV